MGGKLVSSAWAGSIQASAELVVPRSMPTFTWTPRRAKARRQGRSPGPTCRASCDCLPDVEFQFPSPPVARHAPQLQHAGFGDHRFERYRYQFGLVGGQLHLDRREFLKIVAYVFDQYTRRVVLARRGTEKAELSRLVDNQPEFAIGNAHGSPFLHAELRHGQSLDRRGEARHRGHGGLDADVVGTRDTAANAHAFPLPRSAVVSRAARDGVQQILSR